MNESTQKQKNTRGGAWGVGFQNSKLMNERVLKCNIMQYIVANFRNIQYYNICKD